MKKKIGVCLVTVFAVACLLATTAFAAPSGNQTTNGAVNLRLGPSTDFGIVAVIPAGAQVNVTQSDDGSGWSYVKYSSTEGWLATRFLGAAPAPSTPAAATGVYTTTANVNLRSGPGTDYAIYCVLPTNAQITVDSYGNGWAHCTYNNYVGYVSTGYIKGLDGGNSTSGSDSGITINGVSVGGSAAASGAGSTAGGNAWYNGCNYANVYDYKFYKSHHKDLVSVLGDSPDALIQHFVNYGMSEGRQAIASFNVYTYRDDHPDLQSRFGDDLRSYYLYACGLI